MESQRNKLIAIFEKYKDDFDQGYVSAMTEFSEYCFAELKRLGGKATARDIRSYICAAYNIGAERFSKSRTDIKPDKSIPNSGEVNPLPKGPWSGLEPSDI